VLRILGGADCEGWKLVKIFLIGIVIGENGRSGKFGVPSALACILIIDISIFVITIDIKTLFTLKFVVR
jgi:hypothetical protein